MERLGIYESLFGKRRRFLAAAATTIGLSSIAAGCGREQAAYMTPAPPPAATTGAATTPALPAAPAPAAPPAAQAAPEPAAKAPSPAAKTPVVATTPVQAGDEEGIRVAARFTVTGAQLTPESLTVPAFLAVELTLVSGDRREHTLGIATPGAGVRLRVGAGETARLTLPGLQQGEYLVSLDGAVTGATLRAAQ